MSFAATRVAMGALLNRVIPPAGGSPPDDPLAVLHVQNQQTAGTNGGSSVSGLNTRVLNTVVYNGITGASLSANQITLPAGTYYVNAMASGHTNRQTRIQLYNVTDAGIELLGVNQYALTDGNAPLLRGQITIAAEKDFELRHYIQQVLASTGLGVAGLIGRTEVYSDVLIRTV